MQNIRIRPTIDSLVPSATLLINERSKALAAQGKQIFKLGFGQSPFPVPEQVVDALRGFAGEKDYLPVQGLLALREAVSGYYERNYGLRYDASQIMIGPGSKELILSIQLVCDADLLLPAPSWVSYEPQGQIVGSKVHWIHTEESEKWLITAEKLEAACQRDDSRQKMLILNYPSNPVGSTFDKHELQGIAEVARKYELIVVADEIYGGLTFEGDHESLAKFYPERTVVSGGISKWCGAGGWRLGTFCFPKELGSVLNSMMALASESFSAVSAPIQYAGITAFNGGEELENYLIRSRQILKIVSQYVYKRLVSMSVTMPQAYGGFYLFPNFEFYKDSLKGKGISNSVDFCERLLNQTGVALLPGSAFGRPKDEISCRLSFVDFDGQKLLDHIEEHGPDQDSLLKQCPKIIEAMDRLAAWLNDLNS